MTKEQIEAAARVIDPRSFENYDREKASGRLAANGKLWADVAYGEDCEEARRVASLALSAALENPS